jgi:hypothetical protein
VKNNDGDQNPVEKQALSCFFTITKNHLDSFHLPNPFYFTPDFCLSQGMDVALPPLTAGTLYLVATPIGNFPA